MRDAIIIWGMTLFWLATFTVSMLYHTGGHWALPLDDSFIYFQYARQAADGYFLQYNTGATATAGATSLLYMVLLVPGFWLGLAGMEIVGYALVMGYVLLGLSAHLLLKIGTKLAGPFSGWASSLLFMACGPLLWGYLSGMEIGLFSFSILLTFYLFLQGDRRGPYAATLMILSRPEGIVLFLLLWPLLIYRKINDRIKLDWQWLMPLAAYGFQALLIYHYTGSPSASGIEAKWQFSAPHASIPGLLRAILFDFAEFIKGILAGSLGHQSSVNLYAYDGNYRRIVFAPFFALFFVVELSCRIWDEFAEHRPDAAVLAGVWFIAGILATCTLVEYDAHFNRYQQPFLPLYIMIVGLGLGRLMALKDVWGQKLGWGFSCFFALWGLMSAVFFAIAYGENCSDIRNQQIEMAHFIDASLPADAKIAINDAGALRYFANRETIDLVGLTTAGNARSWRNGSGSVFERLESMPIAQRPQYFAIFPNWFNFPEGIFLQPLHRIRVIAPSIIDAEKVLYRANWERIAKGESLYNKGLLAREWRVVDRIDIADLASENKHAYQTTVKIPGSGEANLLLALPIAGAAQAVLVDGGRTVTGGERMRVEVEMGKPALMVMRTVTGVRQHFAITANGIEIGRVDLPGGRGREWLDLAVGEIPASDMGGTIEIATHPLHFGGDLRPIIAFHYWILQP